MELVYAGAMPRPAAALSVKEVTKRLEAFVKADPRRPDPKGVFPAAQEAFSALPEGVDAAVLTAAFAKRLAMAPEVRPDLAGLPEDALVAWLRAAEDETRSAWAMTLSAEAAGDPQRLRRSFQWLNLAAAAPSSCGGGSPEEARAIREAGADARLVKALLKMWPSFDGPRANARPVGWAGILLAEGSEASVRALQPMVDANRDAVSYDPTLDDLLAMKPAKPTAEAQRLLDSIQETLVRRDEASGQFELFRALGGLPIPARFSLSVKVTAKSGHTFVLECSRDARSSGMSWFASIGKQKPVWQARSSQQEKDSLGLGAMSFASLPRWLEHAASALKSRWTSVEVRDEGVDPALAQAVRAWLAPVIGAQAKAVK